MNFLDINNTPNEHIISINNNRNKQNANENEYFTFKEESHSSIDKNQHNNETNIYNVNNNNYYCENKFYLEIPIDHKEQIFSCNRIETYSFRGGNYPNEEGAEHKQQQSNNKSERMSPNMSWIKHMSTCKKDENEIKQHTVDINEPPLTAKSDLITQHSHLQIQSTNRSNNNNNNNNNKIHSITASLSNQRTKIKKGSFHKFLHNQLFPIDFSRLRKHHLFSLNENNKRKTTINNTNNNNNVVINKIKSMSFKDIINKPPHCKNYSIDKRCSSTGTMKYNKTINTNITTTTTNNSFYSYHNINNNNSKHIKKNSNKIIDFQKNKKDLKINNVITTSSKGKYFGFGSALSSSSVKCFSPSLINKHNNSSTLTKYKNIFNTSLHNLTNNSNNNNNSLHLNSSIVNNTNITNNTSSININYNNITSNKPISSNSKRSNLKSFYLFKKDNSMFNLIYPPNTNFTSNNTLYKSKQYININKYSYLKNNFSSSNSLTSNRSSKRKASIGISTYRSKVK